MVFDPWLFLVVSCGQQFENILGILAFKGVHDRDRSLVAILLSHNTQAIVLAVRQVEAH